MAVDPQRPGEPGEADPGAGARAGSDTRAAADGRRGGMSRRALLLAAGTAAGAVAVTGGVVWWRSAQGPASRGQAAGRDTSGRGTPSTTPAGSPALDGQDVVTAVRSAIRGTPMADLTFDGGLTQSEFAAKAHGRIRFHPEVSSSRENCAYAMTVTPAGEPAMDVTMALSGGSAEQYVNGERGGKRGTAGQDHLDMVVAMSGIGVVLDLVDGTEQVNVAGPLHSGDLPADQAPGVVQEQLAGMAGWKKSELEGTRITWELELDRHNRPRRFVLSWVTRLPGGELASTYSTTYENWRQGEITAPG
ncbi:hypothetical protein E1295_28195 [Nonomuraea mesophila]|uniref:Uncharacterized protein n=1 Tax=Nonomuraea mesophila TaxID=2530382 RepID=A0A4R5F3H0_9ACTN|nr:hypothetical protein [Nonomuraea mesophila]TDE42177.1 hypothetical protein E1295_28195 [Nonomuraea mesophila]